MSHVRSVAIVGAAVLSVALMATGCRDASPAGGTTAAKTTTSTVTLPATRPSSPPATSTHALPATLPTFTTSSNPAAVQDALLKIVDIIVADTPGVPSDMHRPEVRVTTDGQVCRTFEVAGACQESPGSDPTAQFYLYVSPQTALKQVGESAVGLSGMSRVYGSVIKAYSTYLIKTLLQRANPKYLTASSSSLTGAERNESDMLTYCPLGLVVGGVRAHGHMPSDLNPWYDAFRGIPQYQRGLSGTPCTT